MEKREIIFADQDINNLTKEQMVERARHVYGVTDENALSFILNPNVSIEQARIIYDGLVKNYNVKPLCNIYLDEERLKELYFAIEDGIDPSAFATGLFTAKQMRVIREAYKSNNIFQQLFDYEYNEYQLNALLKANQKGMDLSLIADKRKSSTLMELYIRLHERKLDHVFDERFEQFFNVSDAYLYNVESNKKIDKEEEELRLIASKILVDFLDEKENISEEEIKDLLSIPLKEIKGLLRIKNLFWKDGRNRTYLKKMFLVKTLMTYGLNYKDLLDQNSSKIEELFFERLSSDKGKLIDFLHKCAKDKTLQSLLEKYDYNAEEIEIIIKGINEEVEPSFFFTGGKKSRETIENMVRESKNR